MTDETKECTFFFRLPLVSIDSNYGLVLLSNMQYEFITCVCVCECS